MGGILVSHYQEKEYADDNDQWVWARACAHAQSELWDREEGSTSKGDHYKPFPVCFPARFLSTFTPSIVTVLLRGKRSEKN